MTAPCAPWMTEADCCDPPTGVDPADWATALAKGIEVATVAGFRLTGFRFNGVCEVTVWPCGCDTGCDPCTSLPAGWLGQHPGGRSWRWEWPTIPVIARNGDLINCASFARCDTDPCSCTDSSPLILPYTPVLEVTEVRVGGVVLAPADYHLNRERAELLRTDGGRWPTCNDVTTNDFTVTYTHGVTVPEDLRFMAAKYACELAKQCLDRACELPKRTIREGDFLALDPMGFVDDGLTGFWPFDAAIRRWNPTLQARPPRTVDPVNDRSRRLQTV